MRVICTSKGTSKKFGVRVIYRKIRCYDSGTQMRDQSDILIISSLCALFALRISFKLICFMNSPCIDIALPE